MDWYNKNNQDISLECKTDIEQGLNQDEVERRQEKYGLNKLDETKKVSLLSRFLRQMKDFMILVLIVAAGISFLLGERVDAVIILAIVIINAVLGVFQEERAERALEALKKLSSPHTKVIRQGRQVTVNVDQLVFGDLVVLEAGDFVPADIRLTQVMDLRVEESSLTGESLPVEKSDEPISAKEVSLGDRINMAFMGSVVTYGRARGIVVETGMKTQMGSIAKMIAETEEEATPLQKKLASLGKVLAIVSLAICFLIFIVGILRGNEVFEMFMTSISLAVAAIPEGLPSIVTITLALGMQRMVKKKSIVRRLPAVETLGSTTVICSDKTGTLTMNKMTMQALQVDGEVLELTNGDTLAEPARFLLLAGILCNDANVERIENEWVVTGDPTEVAYVDLAIAEGMDVAQERKLAPRIDELPFDSDRKMMTTVHRYKDQVYSFTKGAPDEIIDRCTHIERNGRIEILEPQDKLRLLEENEQFSSRALRVLAVACKRLDENGENDKYYLENTLTFIGLTAMMDPPREEAKEAIALCKKAGIKTVMITGDHGITAMAIAEKLGLENEGNQAVTGAQLNAMSDMELERDIDKYRVYARVSPEHKVRIVKAWKKRGDIVAMTGDGVNDAPALKNADIGVAMGITGTEVAKGASDMIINDDNFATIVTAVKEGRQIFSNILKAVQFLLGCNIGEIVVIFAAIMIGFPTPLRPIHILWINLVTDSFIALALGFEPEEGRIMEVPPREPNASIFSDGLGWRVAYQGIMIGLITLVAFWWGYQIDLAKGLSEPLMGSTMAFMTLAFSQLVHSFNVKSPKVSLLRKGILNNKALIGAFFLSSALQLMVALTPFTRSIFEIELLGASELRILILLVLSPLLIVEVEKFLTKRLHSR
ncbi:cation-translocating P-type ATPase [Clostridia bacterium]|nr:cation-translocating P-type ATPase [Clostridia bacterium]